MRAEPHSKGGCPRRRVPPDSPAPRFRSADRWWPAAKAERMRWLELQLCCRHTRTYARLGIEKRGTRIADYVGRHCRRLFQRVSRHRDPTLNRIRTLFVACFSCQRCCASAAGVFCRNSRRVRTLFVLILALEHLALEHLALGHSSLVAVHLHARLDAPIRFV